MSIPNNNGLFRPNLCPCPFLALGFSCSLSFCVYSHSKDDRPLCVAWTRGECNAIGCRDRHYYDQSDNTHQSSPQGPRTRLLTRDFSSPYVVRVNKETEKRKRIEVDLETGERFSFDETVVKEVVDLTANCNTPTGERREMVDVFSPLSPSCIVYSSKP